MSFTAEVKDELSRIDAPTRAAELAQLSALVRICGTLSFRGSGRYSIRVATETGAVARTVIKLTHKLFDLETSLTVRRSVLHKTRNYLIEIPEQEGLDENLVRLGILVPGRGLASGVPTSLVSTRPAAEAYVRGAFMAGGFIADPRGDFHLEIAVTGEEYANDLVRLAALLGALMAQIGYKCPSIGGKDSMSGSFNDLDVPPTLVSFAVGMSEASKTVSSQFKRTGSSVKMLPLPVEESTGMPNFEKAMELMMKVFEGVRNGSILSASVVKEGGAAACVCKMAFGNKFGFTFAQNLDKETLFAAKEASFVVELADGNTLDGITLGTTNDNGVFIIDGVVQTVDELIDAWTGKLEKVFATDSGKKANMPYDVPLYKERSIFVAKNKVAKPKVFIPAFPGTNCEVDTARAFEKAGAQTSVLVVNNLSSAAINETIDKMVKEIESSQIIMLPGGFSGGDEPEGSGKFIATTFRNPRVKEAVTKLLNCRDGLMLGICNGFQALIKLGLVPYGEIREIKETDPTLTFNTIGRHISSMAYTRVSSVKSPWFSGVHAGDVFAVPISHGEGRFVADDQVMKKLIENGQVATQYVNPDGMPVSDMPFNPNGSVCAVEGITSPDGRVLGKMGHCERKGENLYANVPFEKDMKIFESGVNYFK